MIRPAVGWCSVVLLAATLALAPAPATAQDRVGGHFGVALPLVSRAQGQMTTIADDFVIVFSTGITVRQSNTFAFDLELAPVVQHKTGILIVARPPDTQAAGTYARPPASLRRTMLV
jgi:hypothetical protein